MTLLNAVLQNDTVKVLVLGNQKPIIEYYKDPTIIIAVLAIIVTLMGLWISASYSRQTLEHTIKHSKLSVEPILNIPFSVSQNDYTIRLEMYNSGIGTAIIDKFSLVYKNETVGDFSILLYKHINFNYKLKHYSFPDPPINIALAANNSLCLLDIKFNNKEEFNEVYDLLKTVKYDIDYETMYGEKRTYNNEVV
ncbi:MAG: hypothetical protein JZU53_13435 [Paludibacter sp.]|nr:hypothetical protein [Paludibacter sp.]